MADFHYAHVAHRDDAGVPFIYRWAPFRPRDVNAFLIRTVLLISTRRPSCITRTMEP